MKTEIRPWINFAFLYQEERFGYLQTVLNTLAEWPVKDMKIMLAVNHVSIERLMKLFNLWTGTKLNVTVEFVDITKINPYFLQWKHKDHLQEFINSKYTHFIYADADLVIKYEVMEYWVKTKKLFDDYKLNFIPGTFRTEEFEGIVRSSDITYRTDVAELKIISLGHEKFFSPQEPFQGISIFNKEMAKEHLDSPYVSTDSVGVYGFGYSETGISGYIFHNTPEGFISRVLLPIDNYTKCWIDHLPANYAANPYKEHGKIHAHTLFRNIKNMMR
jgi:hypothetical protein